MTWTDKWVNQLAQLTPEQRFRLSQDSRYMQLENRLIIQYANVVSFKLYVKLLAVLKIVLNISS